MILSIGMIVKNEEKYLDKCLSALIPIMTSIKSELIIVDTGSTDKTIEIAKKYTDKVYTFEWCNDFSKARNETLKYVSGKWYMFLDADEILKNADELIELFNSGNIDKYNTIIYTLHNYESTKSDLYRISTPSRIFRRGKDTKFTGTIHESISSTPPILVLKNTVFDHFGYSSDDKEAVHKKIYRNINLLNSQIDSGLDNPRLRMQLADCYIGLNDREKSIKTLKIGIEMSKNLRDSIYLNILYANLFLSYRAHEMYESIMCESENYFEKESRIATDIDVYHLLCISAFNLKNYKDCIKYYNKYIELKIEYDNGKLDTPELILRSLGFADEKYMLEIKLCSLIAYSKIKKVDDFKELSNSISIESVKKYNFQTLYIRAVLEMIKLENNFFTLKKLYIDFSDEYRIDLENETELFIADNPLEKYMIYRCFDALNESIYANDKYINLMKIRALDSSKNKNNNISKYIEEMISNDFEISLNYSDYIYYVIKYNLDIKKISTKIANNNMHELFEHIGKIHSDFSEYISKYKFEESNEISDIYMKIELLYYCIENLTMENSYVNISMFEYFLSFVKKYINLLYNTNYLAQFDIIAPKSLSFGYNCLLADDILKDKNYVEYVRLLKKILLKNHNMQNIIMILVKNLEPTKKNDDLSEFENLALTIKSNIDFLINNNQITEARYIFEEYKKINPADTKIDEYEKKLY